MSIFKRPLLLVMLPQEEEGQEKSKELTLQMLQEKIGVMEAIYSNISGLKASQGFFSKSFSNHISFEIVAQDNLISFYVCPPARLKQFISQQIQAQFPHAHIEEVEDYNIFSPRGYIDGVYLQLKRNFLLPIKTYLNLQADPLNALVNTLSKMESDDGAAIQYLVRPAGGGWRFYGTKVASEVKKGKSLKDALKAVGSFQSSLLSGLGDELYKAVFGPSSSPKEESPEKKHIPSPMEEEAIKSIENKISKAGLEVNIRIIVSADKKEQMEMYLENILNSFSQYSIYEYGNSFIPARPLRKGKVIDDFIYRNFDAKRKVILNAEEMTSLFHFPLPSSPAPNIRWLSAKEAPAPAGLPQSGIILGENIYREKKTIVRIAREDRARHVYLIGKSGVGKSNLLTNMAVQDIRNGDGVGVIDPHGDLVDDILEAIPKERVEDVIYFDPASERPMGLNLLEYDKKYPEQKSFVINEMIKIFDKLYDLRQTGGPMFEQYMRNAMLLVMEDPESGSTLMEIPKVLADAQFRRYKLSKCPNPVVRDFWQKEAEKAGGEAALANMVPYITSKLTSFVSNDLMRPIIGQQKSAFDIREIMDNKKILLVNLSKGKIGEMNAFLLGLVLVGKVLMAALSRTDLPKEERKDFYFYLDEFQNFITDSISVILSEARKYRLNLNIAHQYIGQLIKNQDTSVRDAIFGNVGTLIAFKVGAEDAEFLAKEFAPVFDAHDLVNIDKYNAYIKLTVNNQPLRAFNIHTFPFQKTREVDPQKIKRLSALKYGRDKSVVEAEILKRMKIIEKNK